MRVSRKNSLKKRKQETNNKRKFTKRAWNHRWYG
jgi:hypothetical protein